MGLIVGGTAGTTAIGVSTLVQLTGWPAALLSQPAVWAMPIALATMVFVSRRTQHRLPAGVDRIMIRLHTPESVGVRRTWTARG